MTFQNIYKEEISELINLNFQNLFLFSGSSVLLDRHPLAASSRRGLAAPADSMFFCTRVGNFSGNN